MTMLEQIARAIFAENMKPKEITKEDLYKAPHWNEYEEDARVALMTMRNFNHAKTKAQRDTWYELIDAILNEEDK